MGYYTPDMLRQVVKLEKQDLRRHASVSTDNRHKCTDCFCCCCVDELQGNERLVLFSEYEFSICPIPKKKGLYVATGGSWQSEITDMDNVLLQCQEQGKKLEAESRIQYPFAHNITDFQKLQQVYAEVCETMGVAKYKNCVTEEHREAVHQAGIALLQEYNRVLTELQELKGKPK